MEESIVTYKESGKLKQNISVYIDGKRVGTIKPVPNGFAYYPLGSRTRGEVMPTVEEIKHSLEEL